MSLCLLIAHFTCLIVMLSIAHLLHKHNILLAIRLQQLHGRFSKFVAKISLGIVSDATTDADELCTFGRVWEVDTELDFIW